MTTVRCARRSRGWRRRRWVIDLLTGMAGGLCFPACVVVALAECGVVQCLNVAALGLVTPGPVALTVSAVDYTLRGVRYAGVAVATFAAFAPSLGFVLLGARQFERLRTNTTIESFLAGAGPSVIGAIGASALTLTTLLAPIWQVGVLAGGPVWLRGLGRNSTALLAAPGSGVLAV